MLAVELVGKDVRDGLSRPQKQLSPKYFYDADGSRLFERICDQPEYYVTRTELGLLASRAAEIADACPFDDLVELGSGSTRKARLLLDARARSGGARRYVPLDVSRSVLEDAVREVGELGDGTRVHPVEGDFLRDLHLVPPRSGRRLVAFLGSTIGNLTEREASSLLVRVRRLLRPSDRLLLGADLVKDRAVLEPAYNDAAGVTAAFNQNILRVVSRELDGDARPELFEHVAFFNEAESRIEMHLRARESHAVRFSAIDFSVSFRAGETIHTENSRKWTRPSLEALLGRAGLAVDHFLTDEKDWFSLTLARVSP